jgi:hypothetical protein
MNFNAEAILALIGNLTHSVAVLEATVAERDDQIARLQEAANAGTQEPSA